VSDTRQILATLAEGIVNGFTAPEELVVDHIRAGYLEATFYDGSDPVDGHYEGTPIRIRVEVVQP
jgi:hypothetical protein